MTREKKNQIKARIKETWEGSEGELKIEKRQGRRVNKRQEITTRIKEKQTKRKRKET